MNKEKQPGFASFAKSTFVFFVGNTLSKIITIALLPLYTNALPSEDYGYFDVSVTYITLLTSFLYCDIWTSVMRFMREDLEGDNPKVVSASGFVVFGCSTALYYLLGFIAGLLFNIPSLFLILIYGTALNLQTMFSYIARGWGDNVRFALSGIISAIVNVTLSIILILFLGWGYQALYVSFVAGALSQCAYLFFTLKLWTKLTKPNYTHIKELFLYSVPLCLNSVAYWLLNSFGRIVISSALSLHASGIFAVGSKFGSIINLATTCFTYAWQDISFTSEVKPSSFYSKAVTYYTLFLVDSFAILLPIVTLLFPVLVGSGYAESYYVIPTFLAAAVISAISTFIGNIFYVIKDTKTIGKTMALSCLVNVVLTYPLTILFGLNGTNFAIILAFAMNIGIRLNVLRKKIGLIVSSRIMLLRSALVVLSITVYSMNNNWTSAVLLVLEIVLMLHLYGDRISGIINMVLARVRKQ